MSHHDTVKGASLSASLSSQKKTKVFRLLCSQRKDGLANEPPSRRTHSQKLKQDYMRKHILR
ncbi:hypothetical protein NW766_007841 [Fusarium irregulare]|uniref:Uncharacterized protein n=1 Tax=Fusarium irregulare TaxID=2494466 RepID=A0A9W8PM30_9HYPO|nr:hypothetical protein NW766_007841 [Fusarium irregulare]